MTGRFKRRQLPRSLAVPDLGVRIMRKRESRTTAVTRAYGVFRPDSRASKRGFEPQGESSQPFPNMLPCLEVISTEIPRSGVPAVVSSAP